MNGKTIDKSRTTQHETFTELLGQLAGNSAAVVHDEIELVIQGIREKTRAVRSGAVMVATGAVIGFAAFMSLCASLIIGLTSYMSPVIAALVTGAALALISVVIALIGYTQLKKSALKTQKILERRTSNG
jgi:hypothetical protein